MEDMALMHGWRSRGCSSSRRCSSIEHHYQWYLKRGWRWPLVGHVSWGDSRVRFLIYVMTYNLCSSSHASCLETRIMLAIGRLCLLRWLKSPIIDLQILLQCRQEVPDGRETWRCWDISLSFLLCCLSAAWSRWSVSYWAVAWCMLWH